MSKFFKARGITFFWIEVVLVYFASSTAFKMSGCKFNFSNALIVVPCDAYF
jgi:hypothetical protein